MQNSIRWAESLVTIDLSEEKVENGIFFTYSHEEYIEHLAELEEEEALLREAKAAVEQEQKNLKIVSLKLKISRSLQSISYLLICRKLMWCMISYVLI